MRTIYVKLRDALPSPFNNVDASLIGTGLLVSDLIDTDEQPTGISLSEGADPFTGNSGSGTFADESPDPRLQTLFFQSVFTGATAGEKFVLAGFSPGVSYTLELAGQNANVRDTQYSSTNSSPVSVVYDVQADPDPDPFIATQPVVLEGTANASGEIRISAEIATSVSAYCNGFILTYGSAGPSITLSTTAFTPNATITCQLTNFATYPTEVTLTDSASNTLTLPLTQVLGDEHTFQIPAAPALGASVQLLKAGNVTVSATGVA